MSRAFVRRSAVTLALLVGARARLSAQASVRIRAARTDTIALDSSRASTAVFAINNDGRDTARVHPRLLAPPHWTTLTDSAALRIAPHGMDTWLASVSAPANASAGLYVLRAMLAESPGAVDSIVIRVAEVRAAELLPIDVPGWVVSGGDYAAKFIVRNRGNVVTTFRLAGTTSRGRRCTVDVPSVTLAPGASATVTLRVVSAPTTVRASDDVVELIATDAYDAGTRVSSSARTTVVPRGATLADRATIPAEFAVRAMSGTAGVSPVTFTSSGTLADRKTWLDLSYHAKPKMQSAFGEREEYHVTVRRDDFSARIGDGLYGFSPLTSPTSLGLGGSIESTIHGVGAGVYAERSRWGGSSQPIEAGAFIGSPRDAVNGLSASAVSRRYANGAASELGGVGSRFSLARINASVSIDAAGSRDSAGVVGVAERVRVSGTSKALTYDVGHARGSPSFDGAQRGLEQDDALLNLQVPHNVSLAASGMMTVTTPSLVNIAAGQQFASITSGATYAGAFTLDYVRTSRRDLAPGGLRGTQQGARVLASVPLRALQFSTTLEGGAVNEASHQVHGSYVTMSASTRWNFAAGRGITVFGDYGDGHTLGGDGRAVVSGGASADLRLASVLDLSVLSTATSIAASAPASSGVIVPKTSFGQVDARLTYRLPTGASFALRAHLWSNAAMQGSTTRQLMFLEYHAPLRLPVGRTEAGHRVEGRVVEAGTGKPVAGTLVRVGDQAAVTDKNGRVILAGLRPGKYPVSVEAPTPASRPLVEETPSVEVRPDAKRAATFEVRLADAGRVRVAVRKLGFAGSLSTSDSLVDEGAQANVLVALQGARDTLYQATDERGRIDFGQVPTGSWTLSVRSDAGDGENDAQGADPVRVMVVAGVVKTVDLKLMPRKRAITFVGGDVLNAAPEPQRNQRSQKN